MYLAESPKFCKACSCVLVLVVLRGLKLAVGVRVNMRSNVAPLTGFRLRHHQMMWNKGAGFGSSARPEQIGDTLLSKANSTAHVIG